MNAPVKRLSTDEIRKLYKKYQSIIKLETEDYHVKPTEVRHLIGRLGEFHCALEVDGTLALNANQHGFDVEAKSGTKISVKTTAQTTGFIPISVATAKLADKLMVLHFTEGKLKVIYFGEMSIALKAATLWTGVGRYNLSIAKARKLNTYKPRL